MLGAMPNMYALVVGIDEYPDPVRTLEGCVNDANAFANVLTTQYKVPASQVMTLLNAQATRAAVIQGFREHLGQAKTDDIAVFFYAGHGSQEPTSSYYLPIEPDGKNETIVCYDSRSPGGYDLVDKDVAVLIQEVAAKGAQLTLVLDSCHSGSADRALDDVGSGAAATAVRRAPDRTAGQPDSAYLQPPADFAAALRNVDAPTNTGSGGNQAQSFVQGAGGAHVLFAACSDFQNANEYRTVTPKHGAFTYCLLQVLQDGTPLGNQELYERARDLLTGIFPDQLAHLVVVGNDALRAGQFLGNGPAAGGSFFMARCDKGVWKINGGQMQGLGAGDTVALYAANAASGDLTDASKALTTAKILQAGPSESTVTVADPTKVSPQQDYKAAAIMRSSRLPVALSGDAAAAAALRTALQASLYVQEGASPQFTVQAAADGYHVAASDPKRPAPDPFPLTPQGVAAAVAALEHMAQWTTRVGLTNPASQIPVSDVDVAISYYDSANTFQGAFVPPLDTLNLQYKRTDAPTFRMRMTNRGSKQYYFAVLACSGDWGISTNLLAEECTMLDTTQELFAAAGNEIPMQLKPGATEAHDHIVVVISTEWFDAASFSLPNLTGTATRDFGQPLPAAPAAPTGDFTTRHFEIVTRQAAPPAPAS